MKIGRNQLCPCGSGKKYKKCCLFKSQDINKIAMEMNRQMFERKQRLAQAGIFIDFVIPVEFKGKKVWALGSRLYPNQPLNSTFHEFVVDVLRQELGREWWEAQRILPEENQHFVFKCFRKHFEWQAKNQKPENKYGKGWRAKPDGYSRALISLAFDVCSLIHAIHLPQVFLDKLRRPNQYQSVRYEIAVSAMFARMGYKIRFLDEEVLGQKNQPKHSEFIATHPQTGEEIVVEVKSKERKGVLHKEGDFNEEREFRSSITKLYRHALEQKPANKPFIIFIDMNLPLSPGVEPGDNLWVQAVTRMRDSATFATKGKPSPTNAIVFTNYSYHYGTDQETGSGEWLLEKSGNPEVLIKSIDFGDKFMAVLQSYGNVPNLDMEVST